MSELSSTPVASLTPLAYLREMVAYLKEHEPELWSWGSSVEVLGEYRQQIRAELLKANYRLDAEAHPELAERCGAVARRLEITSPVTLYQANGAQGLNAMLCHLPGEAHIVFSGPILATVRGAELDAVLGHELAHHQLWERDGGEFLVADRLLGGAASDERAALSHLQSARRYRLYTEIYADRGGLVASGQLEATVAALVKCETGLAEVSGASYLRQADEIFASDGAVTRGVEHPESYLRARALRLWSKGAPELEQWLGAVIEGPLRVDELDLPGQKRLAQLTRRLLRELLRPAWFQTEAVLNHARSFFPDFEPATGRDAVDDSLAGELGFEDAATRAYFNYILLDFTAVDPVLEELPLAAALQWSRRWEGLLAFEKLALKELGVAKRVLSKLKKDAPTVLLNAEKGL